MGTIFGVGLFPVESFDHRRDWQVKLSGELKVPLITGWHRHDRPGPVGVQDVVGRPDW